MNDLSLKSLTVTGTLTVLGTTYVKNARIQTKNLLQTFIDVPVTTENGSSLVTSRCISNGIATFITMILLIPVIADPSGTSTVYASIPSLYAPLIPLSATVIDNTGGGLSLHQCILHINGTIEFQITNDIPAPANFQLIVQF